MRTHRAGWLCAAGWRSVGILQRSRWQGGFVRVAVSDHAGECPLAGRICVGGGQRVRFSVAAGRADLCAVGWICAPKGCYVRRSVDYVRRREESPPRRGRGHGAPRQGRGWGALQGGGRRRGGRREAPAQPTNEKNKKKHPREKKLKACRLPNEGHKMTA